MKPNLLAAGHTDVGRLRAGNEDSFLLEESIGLFAVADGMGGHVAGEVASLLAVEALREVLNEGETDEPKALLLHGFFLANKRIRQEITRKQERQGMGTTLVAALVLDGSVYIANVGDSRMYLIREGEIEQLTTDHSWVMEQVNQGRMSAEEAAKHPYRNVITRALGSRDDVEVDQLRLDLRKGDRLLLCSDGLTTMLKDETILSIILEAGELDEAVNRLIDAANKAGGEDNVTAIVIGYED